MKSSGNLSRLYDSAAARQRRPLQSVVRCFLFIPLELPFQELEYLLLISPGELPDFRKKIQCRVRRLIGLM
jgi:hypothetical protein